MRPYVFRKTVHKMQGTVGETLWEPLGPKTGAKRKFTREEVLEIRNSPLPGVELAIVWGVTPHTIYNIKGGINYAWVV